MVRLVSSFVLVPMLLVPLLVAAEVNLVLGMGRSLGWVVATNDGTVRFRTCQGTLLDSPVSRSEPTSAHCPHPAAPVTLHDTIRAVDPAMSVPVSRVDDGTDSRFWVAPDYSGDLPIAGARLTIRDRVTGHVTAIMTTAEGS
jgi:hypothetical protein